MIFEAPKALGIILVSPLRIISDVHLNVWVRDRFGIASRSQTPLLCRHMWALSSSSQTVTSLTPQCARRKTSAIADIQQHQSIPDGLVTSKATYQPKLTPWYQLVVHNVPSDHQQDLTAFAGLVLRLFIFNLFQLHPQSTILMVLASFVVSLAFSTAPSCLPYICLR